MEQEISILAGCDVKISFTPHLLPITRGILSTIYATLQKDVTTAELIDLYRAFYKEKKFVRVYKAGTFPNISSVRGSNYCDIGLVVAFLTAWVAVKVFIKLVENYGFKYFGYYRIAIGLLFLLFIRF